MNISRTFEIGAVVVAVAVLAGALWTAPEAQAKNNKKKTEDAQWSDWSALGAGYVARRREPPKMHLAPSERILARTQRQTRGRNLASRADGESVPESFGATVFATGVLTADAMEAPVSAPSSTTVNKLWFYTTVAGMHKASITDIALHTGKTEKKIRKKAKNGKLSITNAGQAVAWHFDKASDAILFAASAYDSFHARVDAYHLLLSGKLALPMVKSKQRKPATPGSNTPFVDTLHFEEEPDFQFSTWLLADEPDGDYWFWDYLYGGYKDKIEVALQVPNPAPAGIAQLRIALRGWTDLEPGDEHVVYARLNGVDIGSAITWDGFNTAELVAEIDQGLLEPAGQNTLTLHNSYAPGTHPGQYLDAIEITYSRLPKAENDSLWLHGVAAGAQLVSGFSSEDVVVIESPAGDAVWRRDAAVKPDGLGGWSVTFNATAGADYLVAERSSAHRPTVAPDFPSALAKRDNAADYLIIAPREFSATAQSLASYRSARFSQVKVVWLDDIYDEFSDGRADPVAITRFMQRVQTRWQMVPSVVVITGNGTLDHKGRMGYADSFVPVSMTSTPWALAPSDDRLLNNTDPQQRRFAIGRLPITNDQEGLAYLEKLRVYESGDFDARRHRALLVADNPDKGGDFHANSEQLATQLLSLAGFDQVARLYHPRDAVRSNLLVSSAWEVGYVSYDGHGSTAQAGDGNERFVTAADAKLLQNAIYPVFTALTCAAGDYSWPGTRSLAGALVLNPVGGAMVSVAPTGLSLDADAQQLGAAFVDSLFTGSNTVGDALLEAETQTAGSIRDFMPHIYAVVGEPAVYAR
jgi:Peptidase family C25